MENPQKKQVIDRPKEWFKAEETAWRLEYASRQVYNIKFSNRAKPSGRMCHCSECKQEHPEPRPPAFEIVAHIKNCIKPDGVFRTTSKCGAEISLHACDNGVLLLVAEGPGSKFESWELPRC